MRYLSALGIITFSFFNSNVAYGILNYEQFQLPSEIVIDEVAKDTIIIPFNYYNCSSCNIFVKSLIESLAPSKYLFKLIVNISNERKARMRYDFNVLKNVEILFDEELYKQYFSNADQCVLIKSTDGLTNTCRFEHTFKRIEYGRFKFLDKVKTVSDSLLIDMMFHIERIDADSDILIFDRTKEMLLINYKSKKVKSLNDLTEYIYINSLHKIVEDKSLIEYNLDNQDMLMGTKISHMNLFGGADSSLYLISDFTYISRYTNDSLDIRGRYLTTKLGLNTDGNILATEEQVIYPQKVDDDMVFIDFRNNILSNNDSVFQTFLIKDSDRDTLVQRIKFGVQDSITVYSIDSFILKFPYSYGRYNKFWICECDPNVSSTYLSLRHDFYFKNLDNKDTIVFPDNFSNYTQEVIGAGNFRYFVDKCIIHNGHIIALNGCQKGRYEIIVINIDEKQLIYRKEFDTTGKRVTIKLRDSEPLFYSVSESGALDVYRILF